MHYFLGRLFQCHPHQLSTILYSQLCSICAVFCCCILQCLDVLEICYMIYCVIKTHTILICTYNSYLEGFDHQVKILSSCLQNNNECNKWVSAASVVVGMATCRHLLNLLTLKNNITGRDTSITFSELNKCDSQEWTLTLSLSFLHRQYINFSNNKVDI